MKNKLIEPLLEEDTYHDIFDALAHFNFKLTNSNVSGSIRVSKNYRKSLPYACIASAHEHDISIPLDYTRGAYEAKAFKHLVAATRIVDEGKINELESLLKEEQDNKRKSSIKEKLKTLKDRAEAKPHYAKVKEIYESKSYDEHFRETDKLDPRLTQVLVPKDGGYVSITPLASSGYGHYVHDLSKGLKLQRAHRSIGGSKSLNVGGLVYACTQGVLLSAPREDHNLKSIYRAIYKRPEYRVPEAAFKEYLDWRSHMQSRSIGMEHNARVKSKDIAFVIGLSTPFHRYLKSLRQKLATLENVPTVDFSELPKFHADCLKFCSSNAPDRDVCKGIANEIVWSISRHKDRETNAQISWNQSEISHFIKVVSRELYA